MDDVDQKERCRRLLDELPLSEGDRALYRRGLERMTDEDARICADQLEAGLAASPEALAAAKRLLARLRAKKDDKPRP